MNIWDSLILNPMINALLYIYDFLGPTLGLAGAFGLAIIVFTILIRVITLPLTYKQQQSTQKMQELQKDKEYIKIQEKYKGDRQKLQEEQMKLYKKLGINPFAGCVPTIIQLPVIFGLYGAIIRSLADSPTPLLEFSKHIYTSVSSTIIPLNSQFLWMDLGQPERFAIPALEGLPVVGDGLPVLAVIVIITSYLQTKLTTPPQTGAQGAGMTQMMGIYMPLLLGWFAYTLAAGLALYFVVSNVLAIGQALLMKRFRSEPGPEPKKSKGSGRAHLKGKADGKAKGKKNPPGKQARGKGS
ncbi:MAG: YidC/Oxa1 family membrane protein insertase [Chloroflexi bacterium]|nr:YidC/Oxa1 family membrane protein insertase [Chloroflexota bacterium]